VKRAAAALLVAVVIAAAVPAAAAGPLVAAHRGGALLWPENSRLAYRNALALGVDFLETDVHLTADGEVVVLHDPTLDRTTTAQGAVRDVKLGDLAGVRLKGADGAATAEHVPTLRELLDLLRPSKARLLLEIKVGPGRQPYAGIEEKVLALVKDSGLLERTVIMAFEGRTVRRIRELEPRARTTLLVGGTRVERERAAPRDVLRWVTEAQATDLGIDHRVLDGGIVAAARAARVRVAAWTVNEAADIRRVIALGVDIVISDRPDLAKCLVDGGAGECVTPVPSSR
jgi:glycerophosphoryl diester phosphodiesterase